MFTMEHKVLCQEKWGNQSVPGYLPSAQPSAVSSCCELRPGRGESHGDLVLTRVPSVPARDVPCLPCEPPQPVSDSLAPQPWICSVDIWGRLHAGHWARRSGPSSGKEAGNNAASGVGVGWLNSTLRAYCGGDRDKGCERPCP